MSTGADVVVTTVDDALFRDGQALVIVGSEIMLLSDVSSEVVAACADGLSMADLGAHLLTTFGSPPIGQTVAAQTRLLVEQLVGVGVVRVARAAPKSPF